MTWQQQVVLAGMACECGLTVEASRVKTKHGVLLVEVVTHAAGCPWPALYGGGMTAMLGRTLIRHVRPAP